MIQLKLTYKQYQDLFNALFEAEKSLEHVAINAKCISGADLLVEDAEQEALRYKELRHFITETKEVI